MRHSGIEISIKRKLIYSTIPLLFVAFGFILGYGVCYRRALAPIRERIVAQRKAEMLGPQLTEPEKKLRALAYDDPDKVRETLDQISWDTPEVMSPFIGSAPTPGRSGNASINAMQFRYDKEIAVPKPAGLYRIFLTGGSTAFGTGAPSQDRIIAAYLERLLQATPGLGVKCEVVTAACPAWASTQERILIENRLGELEPDLVISFSGNNDVHWGDRGRNVFWFETYWDIYFRDLVKFACAGAGYPPPAEVVIGQTRPVPPATVAARLEKNIRLGAVALGMARAGYFFILQPTLDTTRKPLTSREMVYRKTSPGKGAGIRSKPEEIKYFEDCYQAIRTRLGAFRDPVFHFADFSGLFDGYTAKDEIFVDMYHFGDRGNEAIARAILDQILPVLKTRRATGSSNGGAPGKTDPPVPEGRMLSARHRATY